MEFTPFEKIPRYKRELVITEKLDGTNAQIYITPMPKDETEFVEGMGPVLIAYDDDQGLAMFAGSRNRWIAPGKTTDNYGFAGWVERNSAELFALGEGQHFGEWYGLGIARAYGLPEKRFALFNTGRWAHNNECLLEGKQYAPECCDVVFRFPLGTAPEQAMAMLNVHGSLHVPGFKNPEGIIIYHSASRQLYKQTFEQDGGKWKP